MNIFLWVLQVLLALHTLMGAVWKFSNPEQTVTALSVIPHSVWLTLSVLEILCSIALVIPALMKNQAKLAPIAAIIIALEMLLYCGLQLNSSEAGYGQITYWLAVAAVCAFIAYGRLVLRRI